MVYICVYIYIYIQYIVDMYRLHTIYIAYDRSFNDHLCFDIGWFQHLLHTWFSETSSHDDTARNPLEGIHHESSSYSSRASSYVQKVNHQDILPALPKARWACCFGTARRGLIWPIRACILCGYIDARWCPNRLARLVYTSNDLCLW